jgi:hypothetical protein
MFPLLTLTKQIRVMGIMRESLLKENDAASKAKTSKRKKARSSKLKNE